jgi:hypothetical protein
MNIPAFIHQNLDDERERRIAKRNPNRVLKKKEQPKKKKKRKKL